MPETNDRPSTEILNPHRKEMINLHFAGDVALYRDALNIWAHLLMVVDDNNSIYDYLLADLKPLPHYAEYVKARYTMAETNYILQKSALEAMAGFDALIDEYNADLERIKKEKDGKKIKELVSRAKALFKNPQSETL